MENFYFRKHLRRESKMTLERNSLILLFFTFPVNNICFKKNN